MTADMHLHVGSRMLENDDCVLCSGRNWIARGD
jgi:hypothetical protein